MELQGALRMLPKVPSGMWHSYGFGFCEGDEEEGLCREWSVSLTQKDGGLAGLEIFSLYNPIPEPYQVDEGEPFGPEFLGMVDHEDMFMWISDKPLHPQPYDVSRWIKEVADPCRYRKEGRKITLEIEGPGSHYSEIEWN